MKVKVNESEGRVLNYLVAKCLGIHVDMTRGGWFVFDSEAWVEFQNDYNDDKWQAFRPSSYWAQGGPIIEREGISLECDEFARWHANGGWSSDTPLLAAMRCYVTSKLGKEVEVPDEFVKLHTV